MSELLSREQFKVLVFDRDHSRCVVCAAPAEDAHHLIERRLYPDGGYYLDNGVSLCAAHHYAAEQTTISPASLRHLASITHIVLPSLFYPDLTYTKWGDVELADGTRVPGDLFDEPSIQKLLREAGLFHLYRSWRLQPRILYLPWSRRLPNNPHLISDLSGFTSKEHTPKDLVVTAKIPGEQTTLYPDTIHTRSFDFIPSPTRTQVERLWRQVSPEIPPGWRLCGENPSKPHSSKTPSPDFYLHSIWDNRNTLLSWDDTVTWAKLLGLTPVPLLYRGPFDIHLLTSLWDNLPIQPISQQQSLGYVLRIAESLTSTSHNLQVAQFVT